MSDKEVEKLYHCAINVGGRYEEKWHMLSRQKFLLAMLLEAPSCLSKTALTKWVFLLKNEVCLGEKLTLYDFVPYKYGPFSFTLYRDLRNLMSNGYVDPKGLSLCPTAVGRARAVCQTLSEPLVRAVKQMVQKYSRLSMNELIRYVYTRYPWFASRSQVFDHPNQPAETKTATYTIGYGRLSVDAFLNKLLTSGIRCIVDVRSNPVSRKYGFHKTTLSRLSASCEIEYHHFPELGIPSVLRQGLTSYKDYEALFSYYEKHILPNVRSQIAHAAEIMAEKPSVLMCMESDPAYCHRTPLASVIDKTLSSGIIHL